MVASSLTRIRWRGELERMKSRRTLRPNGSRLGLVGGYGGSLVLVGAAVAVLLMPLLDDSDEAAGE
ncbi:hypothetical protein ACFQ07_06160, partial [Actinomadura adrarensis]